MDVMEKRRIFSYFEGNDFIFAVKNIILNLKRLAGNKFIEISFIFPQNFIVLEFPETFDAAMRMRNLSLKQ